MIDDIALRHAFVSHAELYENWIPALAGMTAFKFRYRLAIM